MSCDIVIAYQHSREDSCRVEQFQRRRQRWSVGYLVTLLALVLWAALAVVLWMNTSWLPNLVAQLMSYIDPWLLAGLGVFCAGEILLRMTQRAEKRWAHDSQLGHLYILSANQTGLQNCRSNAGAFILWSAKPTVCELPDAFVISPRHGTVWLPKRGFQNPEGVDAFRTLLQAADIQIMEERR